ncbi:hypothetical protein A2Y83_05035 [Candidatus Falkowbacteria bacterium RBG_13_39_14]|uniref:Uncharacterized protein n=1 Tax=Candidatus Falkowbacteria bacterium RBG_13_39_14 TaxID=1797985 RepID=A0A1F5S8A5_9BACT|nr:MAG: hypothetical protein A2Y83_05035 [Candidatus Falkowbacteria bacterium RBG_13_39_14]
MAANLKNSALLAKPFSFIVALILCSKVFGIEKFIIAIWVIYLLNISFIYNQYIIFLLFVKALFNLEHNFSIP